MQYPILSSRLVIEPLTASDLESFVSYRQSPEIARFQSWDSSFSTAQAEAILASQKGVILPKVGEWLQLAVRTRRSGENVGDLGLHALDSENLCFEIGFTIATKYQGKGYATEAASALIQQLIDRVGVHKFVANTDSRNASSSKVLSKLGFRLNIAESWTEKFKNEAVIVHHFETLELSPRLGQS